MVQVPELEYIVDRSQAEATQWNLLLDQIENAPPQIFEARGDMVQGLGLREVTRTPAPTEASYWYNPGGTANLCVWRQFTTADFADRSIPASKLSVGAALANLAAASIPADKLVTNAVIDSITAGSLTTAKYADGSVTVAKMATNAVLDSIPSTGLTTAKYADGSVTAPKLAANLGADAISAGGITTAKIANSAITTAKLSDSVRLVEGRSILRTSLAPGLLTSINSGQSASASKRYTAPDGTRWDHGVRIVNGQPQTVWTAV